MTKDAAAGLQQCQEYRRVELRSSKPRTRGHAGLRSRRALEHHASPSDLGRPCWIRKYYGKRGSAALPSCHREKTEPIRSNVSSWSTQSPARSRLRMKTRSLALLLASMATLNSGYTGRAREGRETTSICPSTWLSGTTGLPRIHGLCCQDVIASALGVTVGSALEGTQECWVDDA